MRDPFARLASDPEAAFVYVSTVRHDGKNTVALRGHVPTHRPSPAFAPFETRKEPARV
jgi:hypothetical protein